MQYRLRTLVILLCVGPPLLWGVFLFFKWPWGWAFLLAFLICSPFAIVRLLALRMK
jgi:hypothetical protein